MSTRPSPGPARGCAAHPVGLNVCIFARRYDAAVATASSAILLSIALALVTITTLLVLLPLPA